MSKSLKLYGGTALGVIAMFMVAVNFADRNVADVPSDARLLGALPDPIIKESQDRAEAVAQAEATGDSLLIAAAHADEGDAGQKFGLGRPALPEEIAAWDVDVLPDGRGLPEGSGDVWTGEELFIAKCASCHGDFAEGRDNWPKLAGGEGTLADEDPLKTVGSYWPYLSTVWDYVHRSMPFGDAQSLTADETYAITAYILYSNFMVEDDFILSHENFLDVEMPNADGFFVDDREETEYAMWRTEPCMENCKEGEVQITMRATVLDVTPEEEADDQAAAEPAAQVQVASADAAPAEETTAAADDAADAPVMATAAIDAALAAEGENVFRQCKACHQVGDGAQNRVGPHLNGIMGREIGAMEDFRYSRTMGEMGGVWDEATMAAFLADPRGVVKGTKMAFSGLRSDDDIAAVTEYLKTFSQ